jgi:mxaA protein
MAYLRSLALILCLAGTGMLQAQPAVGPRIELQAARNFGYTMGSLIEHRVRLWLPDGAELLSPRLPSPGAVNDWLDLRTIRWERESGHIVRIDVTYQVFKGVREPETVVIPPLALAYRAADGHEAEIQTPEWPFGLSPLIPPATPDEKVTIRRDAQERKFPTEPAFYRWVAFLTAAALGALALAFRFGLIPTFGRQRPFAHAYRSLSRLSAIAKPDARYDAALRLVHAALAQTHGTPVFPAMLERFLIAHPAFAPLRPEFEQFLLSSQRHFFDPSTTDADLRTRWQALENFCRRCARAERAG